MMDNKVSRVFFSLLCAILLTGCQGHRLAYGPVRSGSADRPLFVPPTLAVTPTPSIAPSPTFSLPSATPDCTNNLTFLEDLTIPDGTSVQAGAALDKQWLVQNSGSCNWNEYYHIKLTDGADMGAGDTQALYPARSGAQATLEIRFTAPAEPGGYTSAWQAFDPDGNPFGDPFYIQIIVQ